MTEIESDIDWSNISDETCREIQRQGEVFLQDQLQTSIAADQRAMTSASIFIGFAGVILAAGFAHWSQHEVVEVLVSASFGSVFFLLASACGFYAARPVDFYYPGEHPEIWWAVRNAPIAELIGGETENQQSSISKNEAMISANHLWLKRGMILALLAPVAASVSFFLFSLGEVCPA